VERLMREAGRRLARRVANGRLRSGPWNSRIKAVSDLLNEELGAVMHPERNGDYRIRGVSCPLSALTGKHPTVCPRGRKLSRRSDRRVRPRMRMIV
jgi:predicted ArsR family transcriptional regulator